MLCLNRPNLLTETRSKGEPIDALIMAKIFCKLESNSGFFQTLLSPQSALLLFITPYRCFCFQRLPFGITSGPEHFQRCMSEILNGLQGTVSMIDNILAYGTIQEEHDQCV